MLRFDLELALLEGTLAVADLPEAWRARVQSDLGVSPPDDRDGALQDVHWYGGIVGGAFQSYTLGNIMSAQFFAAARRDLGDLDGQIGAGEFAPLRAWLTERHLPPRPQVHRARDRAARDRRAAVDRALPRLPQHEVRRALRAVARRRAAAFAAPDGAGLPARDREQLLRLADAAQRVERPARPGGRRRLTAASWKLCDTSTLRCSGRHIPSMRLASFTADPTTVKSSRSLAPMFP